jgi:hypothetical protein
VDVPFSQPDTDFVGTTGEKTAPAGILRGTDPAENTALVVSPERPTASVRIRSIISPNPWGNVGWAERVQQKIHMQPQKLKLGLFLDSFEVPAWVYSSLQSVVNGFSAELRLVILNGDHGRTKQTNGNLWVYSIFNRIDERLFTKEPNPFKPKSVHELLSKAPVINVSPLWSDNSWSLSETDLRKIRDYKLDILIKFGFDGLRFESLNLSKYGTWFYYHGDERKMKGWPPGFLEVAENWPETSSALIAAGGEIYCMRVLYRSHYFTYPISPARQRSYYFWATTPFLRRQIDFLYQHGEEKFRQQTEKFNTPLAPAIPDSAAPSNSLTLIYVFEIIGRLLKEVLNRAFYLDQWFLLFSLKKDSLGEFGDFHKLIPGKGKFWADPHVTWVNGTYYIFIEEFSHPQKRGHISVIEMDESGNWKAPVKVLEKNYHLSYPFIFNWRGKYYMIPETGENKTIDIYECVDFPYKWEFKKTLMKNITAVDTTLLHYGSKWWLFTAVAENEAAAPNVELFLYYSDDPFSEQWNAHPQNPIVSDVKRARPAGDLFIKDGKLFRPSQDCSKAYGYGFDLNEIVILSETEYLERKVTSIRPDWEKRIFATHTYAQQANLTVIDALAYRFRWAKTA